MIPVPRLVAGLLATLLLSGCAGGDATGQSASPGSDWVGTSLGNDGYPLPDDTYTDTAGRQVSMADASTAPVTLVFFGYTHCPDICNVVLANIAAALRGARPAVRDDVRVLFVTTDPARDTTDVVREYLDRFDPSFEGLVAPEDTVERSAKSLFIAFERPDGSHGGSYEVDHGTYTTGFVDGTARVVWSAETTVGGLRSDLERLSRLA